MKFGSLFSGIGGFDLGFERAGMTCAWQVELDPFCRRVLGSHWPDVERHEDVREVDGLGAVDLVCGGFPCQDLSVAGRRAGLAGARSGLFYQFMRILAAVRPRWVVVENVPGLLSSNAGRDMGAVVGTLADLGYGWSYRVLDAQYFGVAQRRRRVFIVGHLGDFRRAAEVLFERESRIGDPPPSRETGTVAPTIPASGAGTSRTGNERTEADMLVVAHENLSATGVGVGGPDDNQAQAGHLVAHALTGRHDSGEDGTGRGTPLVVAPVTSKWAKGTGGPSGDESQNLVVAPPLVSSQEGDKWGSDQWVDAWSGPMDACGLVRRLTPRECERLQGFPDDWTAVGRVPNWRPSLRRTRSATPVSGDTTPDSPRYRAIGNAVAVPVAAWIGRRLMRLEEVTE